MHSTRLHAEQSTARLERRAGGCTRRDRTRDRDRRRIDRHAVHCGAQASSRQRVCRLPDRGDRAIPALRRAGALSFADRTRRRRRYGARSQEVRHCDRQPDQRAGSSRLERDRVPRQRWRARAGDDPKIGDRPGRRIYRLRTRAVSLANGRADDDPHSQRSSADPKRRRRRQRADRVLPRRRNRRRHADDAAGSATAAGR